MIERQVSNSDIRKEIFAGGDTSSRTLALFTESIISLLSSNSSHQAFMDLVSLMGHAFPLAAPALYIRNTGFHPRVYTMLEGDDGGDREARRVMGVGTYLYEKILVGGHPPVMGSRLDFVVVNNPRIKVMLCITSGIHDDIFREWVKILTPAVTKLMDHEVLMHMAYRDGLTGLLNYRAFDEMINEEQDRAGRYNTIFSIMIIDIDYFKRVNDEYGHQTGDIVLKELSEKLLECVRKSDRVFRYGGEEFVIILPHTRLDKAHKLAERIRVAIDKMNFIAGLQITVSIGIGQYSDGLTPGDLVKKADKGLYLAKTSGRNMVGVVKDMV